MNTPDKTNQYPEWALKFKTPATAIHKIKGNLYLYRISSSYDSTKKRAQKKTVEYLGRLTENEGLKSKKSRINQNINSTIVTDNQTNHTDKETNISQQITKTTEQTPTNSPKSVPIANISVKEYGASTFVESISKDILESLQLFFPDKYEEIFCIAFHRLTSQARLKNMQDLQNQSFLSENFPKIQLSKNKMTSLLAEIGQNRDATIGFMKKFIEGADYLAFDVTDLISQSKNIKLAAQGYNSHYNFDPQVNLFYLYSNDNKLPVYYRIFPGDVSGMQALKICIKESGVTNALMVGDKGFCSKNNMIFLDSTGVKFILPLRRDSSYINYSPLENGRHSKAFCGSFIYQKRPIFYYKLKSTPIIKCQTIPEKITLEKVIIHGNQIHYQDKVVTISNKIILEKLSNEPFDQNIDILEIREHISSLLSKESIRINSFDSNKEVIVYRDIKLQSEEISSYSQRIKDNVEGYTLDNFQKKELTFGTIALISNVLDKNEETLYQNFKGRAEIELAFDSYKNLLEADRTYMQSDVSINGWCFINHISLLIYYKILNIINDNNMSSEMTPKDLLYGLSRITKVRINETWQLAEVNSKFRKVLENLKISIT